MYDYKAESNAPEAEVSEPFVLAKVRNEFKLCVDEEEDTIELASALTKLRLPSVRVLNLKQLGRASFALLAVNPKIENLEVTSSDISGDCAELLARAEAALPNLRSVEVIRFPDDEGEITNLRSVSSGVA